MNHLIVVAHPNSDSFNHAIVQTTVHALKAKGHETVVRDLYTLQFEPVLSLEDFNSLRAGQIPDDIKAEQGFITSADVITFIYPIWWTGLPGILKGYVRSRLLLWICLCLWQGWQYREALLRPVRKGC